MGKLNWKERWGRERKENERREIIRGMKGRKNRYTSRGMLDENHVWEVTDKHYCQKNHNVLRYQGQGRFIGARGALIFLPWPIKEDWFPSMSPINMFWLKAGFLWFLSSEIFLEIVLFPACQLSQNCSPAI